MSSAASDPVGTGPAWTPLGRVIDMPERGAAWPFDVVYAGQTCRAFVVLVDGIPRAYLNRCTHVPMELDWQPNQVFDISGRWLLCATHGAHYSPESGACLGGPCRGGLVKIPLEVRDGVLGWCALHPFQTL